MHLLLLSVVLKWVLWLESSTHLIINFFFGMFAAPYNARKLPAQNCLITTLIRLKYLNFRAKYTQNWICKRVIQVKKSKDFQFDF